MLARRPRSRRVYAVLALATFFLGGAVEPVVGWMRDGAVHHESRSAAAAHAGGTSAGEHGHEDGVASPADHPHEPGHEHGTGQDHCTHAHGLFVAFELSLDWSPTYSVIGDQAMLLSASVAPSRTTPPPKA